MTQEEAARFNLFVVCSFDNIDLSNSIIYIIILYRGVFNWVCSKIALLFLNLMSQDMLNAKSVIYQTDTSSDL